MADERSGLLGYLAQQRRVLKAAAYGLTEEQLRATPSASTLSIGVLLKHVALTERSWTNRCAGGPGATAEDARRAMELTSSDTLASLIAQLDAVAADTETTIAGIEDLGRPVPVPRDNPSFSKDVEAWSVRWVLLHLIEEVARHAGHADIIRESIDGATGMELLAAAEDWPESPWLKPWRPKEIV